MQCTQLKEVSTIPNLTKMEINLKFIGNTKHVFWCDYSLIGWWKLFKFHKCLKILYQILQLTVLRKYLNRYAAIDYRESTLLSLQLFYNIINLNGANYNSAMNVWLRLWNWTFWGAFQLKKKYVFKRLSKIYFISEKFFQ